MKVELGSSFMVEGDLWFDNGGSGTGGNMLMLWDTNCKLMAKLYVYDLWAYTETYRVAGYVYDEDGEYVSHVDLKPQKQNASTGTKFLGEFVEIVGEFT